MIDRVGAGAVWMRGGGACAALDHLSPQFLAEPKRSTGISMILQNLASPAIEEAIEANLTEELVSLGRGLPEAELHKTPELVWFFTGQSGPNGVLWSCFVRADKKYVNAKIDEMLDYFNARQVPVGWTVGPSTCPTDLATILESRGFVYSDSTIGMAVDLQALNENIYVNPDLLIAEIEDF